MLISWENKNFIKMLNLKNDNCDCKLTLGHKNEAFRLSFLLDEIPKENRAILRELPEEGRAMRTQI